MRTVGCDPGVRQAGLAAWEDGALRRARYVGGPVSLATRVRLLREVSGSRRMDGVRFVAEGQYLGVAGYRNVALIVEDAVRWEVVAEMLGASVGPRLTANQWRKRFRLTRKDNAQIVAFVEERVGELPAFGDEKRHVADAALIGLREHEAQHERRGLPLPDELGWLGGLASRSKRRQG